MTVSITATARSTKPTKRLPNAKVYSYRGMKGSLREIFGAIPETAAMPADWLA